MGTRSRVGILLENQFNPIKPLNEVNSIYIHWDGYPEGVGQYLLENLTEYDNIEQYISNGDRSSVEKSYYEMREEVAPSKFHSLINFPDTGQEFEYLFAGSLWLVRDLYGNDNEWKNLKEVLKRLNNAKESI